MSNPLNDQVADLLVEIHNLETERDRLEKQLTERGLFPLSGQPPQFVERYRPAIETVERLNQTIDSKRQKLISLELLMLDNSIKDMQLVTRQVDGSVQALQTTTGQVNESIKSLQTTTDKLVKSSTKLERLTTLLVYVTIMLAIIAIYNVALVLGQSNPFYGAIGVIAIFAGLVYFMYRVYQAVRRGELTPARKLVAN